MVGSWYQTQILIVYLVYHNANKLVNISCDVSYMISDSILFA